jgi:hypothetical protein
MAIAGMGPEDFLRRLFLLFCVSHLCEGMKQFEKGRSGLLGI